MSAIWIFVWTLYLIFPGQSSYVSRPSVISAKLKDHATFNCPFIGGPSVVETVIWYKQMLGGIPQKVGEWLPDTDPKIASGFKKYKIKMETHNNSISLTIPRVKKEHEGLYYCGQFSSENFTLSRGTFLVVTDDSDVKVSVSQSGGLDSVPAGASVTLQCSVLSESRAAELQVLWFRAASPQSHPQIIYTHHNSNHQCESDSSTHTCEYNFSKNILSLNDTGTYYCAVAVCGKIIFGNGTRVQLATDKSLDTVVIFLAVALAVSMVAHVVRCKGITCEYGSGKSHKYVVNETTNQGHGAVELKFAASHFSKKTGKSHQGHNNVYTEVIYSPLF
ncbi:uncharacterized protein LOC128531339 [Clarias gariepinus]|uniref:uncharacterized protein LOC128531339 n=1 Tax=Clarias gariepinus TaxID=13013 RepID=UPI00234D7908|nr:uncharacterized protein LOC128531339 [Clarias gariepinus]